jgi:RNA polymerase sigma factor (sigma-70 family)
MTNTMEDYKKVDAIVERYKSGDTTAGNELIERFKPYTLKYVALLTGNGNVNDPDCRRFLSLFIEDRKTRKALYIGRYTQEERSVIFTSLGNLVQICSFMEQEEIIQEMNLVLLTLADRYKEQGKGFTGYVNGSYYYELGRRIHDLIKDPVIYQRENMVSYSDVMFADPGADIDDVDIIDRIDNMLITNEDDNVLNNSWVQGLTCGEVFLSLTPLERLIIKYHDQDNLTDNQIAQRLGLHMDTVRRKRAKAKKTLEREMNAHGLINKEEKYN